MLPKSEGTKAYSIKYNDKNEIQRIRKVIIKWRYMYITEDTYNSGSPAKFFCIKVLTSEKP